MNKVDTYTGLFLNSVKISIQRLFKVIQDLLGEQVIWFTNVRRDFSEPCIIKPTQVHKIGSSKF